MSLEKLHSEPVKDEWLDPYGHLNEAYYLVGFANAAWTFMDYFSIGPDYSERTGCGFYTVESPSEIFAGSARTGRHADRGHGH